MGFGRGNSSFGSRGSNSSFRGGNRRGFSNRGGSRGGNRGGGHDGNRGGGRDGNRGGSRDGNRGGSRDGGPSFKRGGGRGGNRGGNQSFGGQNRSFNGNAKRGGFFKNGGRGDAIENKSFQERPLKRKFDSEDSDMEQDFVEKPKSILKTPNLDLNKSDKKKVKLDASKDRSFQAKTPSTPFPNKKNKSLTGSTPLKAKTVDFDSDEDDEEPYEDKIPGLTDMDFEDSDEDGGSMESYEDMSGEDDGMDLEDLERLGGAESSAGEEVEFEEDDEESETEAVAASISKKQALSAKASKLLQEDSSDESDDELPVKKAVPEKQAKGGKLSEQVIQAESKRRLELLGLSLYVSKPSEALLVRKHLGQIHPFLTSVWKMDKSLLFVFDSPKSRAKAETDLKNYQDQELQSVKFEKAETIKGLLEEPAKNADPTKLHFKRFPDKIGKKSFQILYPQAESYDMGKVGEAVVKFKSAADALQVLQKTENLKLGGSPVLVQIYRADK